MSLIISADQRLAAARTVNIAMAGPIGSGKTTQARTLDPNTTLFVDMEAGTRALGDWPGDVFDVRAAAQKLGVHPWVIARGIACLLSGYDPSVPPEHAYSQQSWQQYVQALGDVSAYAKYTTLFYDSITVASRLAFSWAQTRPEAYSEKTGKPDTRGAYGLLGREMTGWLTQIQHTPGRSTIISAILDTELDDFKRPVYSLQIEGSRTALALPGIFDVVVTLGMFTVGEDRSAQLDPKGTQRAFVCRRENPWGVPAKDRSGTLDMIEPPDLGALIRKINGGSRTDALQTGGIQTPAAA